jgi:site-specific recombinase XerD
MAEGKVISLNSIPNVRLFKEEFDHSKQKPLPNCENGLLCIAFINEVNKALNMLHIDYEQKGKVITDKEVRTVLRGAELKAKGELPKHPTFLDVYKMWLKDKKQSIGTEIAVGTYNQYKGYLYKTTLILEAIDMVDTPIKNFTPLDFEKIQRSALQQWAKGTVIRFMPTVRGIFDYAVKIDLIVENPGTDIKKLKMPASEKKTPVWLEPEHLAAFSTISLEGREDRVRDAFVFCCWTGLATGEYQLLDSRTSANKIEKKKAVKYIEPGTLEEHDGIFILHGHRQKTGTPFRIPLLPEPMRIINKYGGFDNLPFDVVQNQGRIINEIAQKIGFKKKIVWHTARKTMANYLLNVRMINPVYVTEIMGWVSIAEANAYVRVQESSIIRALFGEVVKPQDPYFEAQGRPVKHLQMSVVRGVG